MKKLFLIMLTLLLAIGVSVRAQESTGGFQGTVKDSTGAAVPHANLVLTGTALIGEKVLETDKSGYFRFENLSPGRYTLAVKAEGFAETKLEDLTVVVNTTPIINPTLTVGSKSTVVEVTSELAVVDVTSSTTQTNVTVEQLQFEPHGRTFEGVMAFSPGTSFEPLNGGYSVSGAAYNENAYQIEGMDVGNIQTGVQQATLPTDFVENIQLLTNGYQANEAAALGGVVNVAIKRGTNTWHGVVQVNYEGDPMDASPPTTLRINPSAQTPTTRVDKPYQFYTPKKDHFRYLQPGFTVSGFLMKDRLWTTLGFEPQYTDTRRVVTFNCTANCLSPIKGPRTFSNDTQKYYTTARLDGKITEKIRAYADWVYQYSRSSGTSLPTRDSIEGLLNTSNTNNPDNYQYGIGNVQPNLLFNAGVDWTINNHVISTTRYDYFYNNYNDRGIPAGIRYVSSNIGIGAPLLDGTTIAASSPASQALGSSNIGANTQYLYNQNITKSIREDVSFFKKGRIGTHNLKVGYQWRQISQKINNGYNTALVNLFWNATYQPLGSFQSNCVAINATNIQKYGKIDTKGTVNTPTSPCQGLYGYAVVSELGTTGAASENLHDFYVVDNWTVTKGVTLNLGLRDEREIVPSYDAFASGIRFGFGSKLAPRIGAAWDVLGNGKLKLSANYNVMYDVMKLNLAIGSFGGDYWHNCTYALDDANFAGIQPVRGADGHYCEGTGNANFAGGTVPGNIRFIENQDYRIPANDPSQGAAVDPKLMPYREHEATAAAAYQLTRGWALSATYIRRRLDHAIEDAGLLTPGGETFQIVNPGFNNYYQPVQNCSTCKVEPVASRNYDALEIQAQHVSSRSWNVRGSYTYSKLRGNYSGLAQSDQSDAVARVNPNNNRDFDEPYFQFKPDGTTSNGLLATDRPNRFKVDGFYRTKTYFHSWETSVGLFSQAYQGTPVSSYMDVGPGSGYPVYVEGHGNWVDITADASGNLTIGQPYVHRTPWFLQTDGNFTQSYRLSGAHEGWRLKFGAYASNLFNQKRATEIYQKINSTAVGGDFLAPPGYQTGGNLNYGVLEGPYNYRALMNSPTGTVGTGYGTLLNSEYGKPMAWNTGRTMRFTASFTF